jgi:hypothetical protein
MDDSPARVLAQHDACLVHPHQPDRLWPHDFIRIPRLEHAILMDAALVRKGVGAHDGLQGVG